jgi:hypothetical protein
MQWIRSLVDKNYTLNKKILFNEGKLWYGMIIKYLDIKNIILWRLLEATLCDKVCQ